MVEWLKTNRRRKAFLFAGLGLLLVAVLSCSSLFVRYSGELHAMRLWRKTHDATLVRGDKHVGTAWVYADRQGDYLVFVDESPNYGPYLMRADKNLVASCPLKPLGRIGSNYVLTPVYVSGSMRCVTMDGVKFPKTTWMLGQNSIDFHSVPYDWPPEMVGDWFVRR